MNKLIFFIGIPYIFIITIYDYLCELLLSAKKISFIRKLAYEIKFWEYCCETNRDEI